MTKPLELVVDGDLILRQYVLGDARQIFNLIDQNRAHLSRKGDDTAEKYKVIEDVAASILIPNPDRLRFGVWDGSVLVGTVNLQRESSVRAEFGTYLGEDFQHQGYIAKAGLRLAQFAREQLGYETLVGYVQKTNKPSMNIGGRANATRIPGRNDEEWCYVFDLRKLEKG